MPILLIYEGGFEVQISHRGQSPESKWDHEMRLTMVSSWWSVVDFPFLPYYVASWVVPLYYGKSSPVSSLSSPALPASIARMLSFTEPEISSCLSHTTPHPGQTSEGGPLPPLLVNLNHDSRTSLKFIPCWRISLTSKFRNEVFYKDDSSSESTRHGKVSMSRAYTFPHLK